MSGEISFKIVSNSDLYRFSHVDKPHIIPDAKLLLLTMNVPTRDAMANTLLAAIGLHFEEALAAFSTSLHQVS